MCFVAVHRRYAAGCVQVRVSCALPSLSLPLVVVVLLVVRETFLFVLCSVLCVLAVVCCAFAIESRVRLGRVSPTPIAQKKKALFHHDRHGVAIRNPQRHRYLEAFFRNSIMPFRHGAAMAAI